MVDALRSDELRIFGHGPAAAAIVSKRVGEDLREPRRGAADNLPLRSLSALKRVDARLCRVGVERCQSERLLLRASYAPRVRLCGRNLRINLTSSDCLKGARIDCDDRSLVLDLVDDLRLTHAYCSCLKRHSGRLIVRMPVG